MDEDKEVFDLLSSDSEKTKAFISELISLCKKHGVQIGTNDSIQLYSLPDDHPAIYCTRIDDLTKHRSYV